MNILITVQADGRPVRVSIKPLAGGGFRAQTLDPNPVEAQARTFNAAVAAIAKRAAYGVDVDAA